MFRAIPRQIAFWGGSLALAASLHAQILFTDVSTDAGISSDRHFSSTAHSLGVNWIDFNVDGWPDLFAVGGDPDRPARLYRNLGDGTFAPAEHLLPGFPEVEMTGSRFADYDRDGDPDLFIYTDNILWDVFSPENAPDGPANLLLRNLWMENGGALPATGPLFEDATAEAGLADLATPVLGPLPGYRSKSAAWLDADRDGCIDLYVGHMVINAVGSPGNQDRFYRNLCDGTFEGATVALGLAPAGESFPRAALVVGGFHLDDDLWPDLYVANVTAIEPQPASNDLIFHNDGGVFTEITGAMPGIGDDAQGAMGIDVADLDLDGDWDLYLTDLLQSHYDTPPRGDVLYLGDGAGGFEDNSFFEAGLTNELTWGVSFFDVDQDGLVDLFLGTGDKHLYRNLGAAADGQIRFAEAALLTEGNTRGSAVADYDRDGDLDLATVDQNGPVRLFRNETSNLGHWLALELRGTASNLDAIGAVVEVVADSVKRRRQVKGGVSSHSQDAFTVHFGLGAATQVETVRVRWPSGRETALGSLAVDQILAVSESEIFRDGFESGETSAWPLP